MSEFRNISDGLDLTPIEERLNKVPKLELEVYPKRGGEWHSHCVMTTTGYPIAHLNFAAKEDGIHIADVEDYDINFGDLFAHAPADITALLAEVKRLRDVEEELRDRIDDMVYTCEH